MRCFIYFVVQPSVDLIMYVFRLGELEGELSGARERVIQLQGEKEKALADLNNIRKINRTIEKSVHTYTCTYTCYMQYMLYACTCSTQTLGTKDKAAQDNTIPETFLHSSETTPHKFQA